MDLNATVTTRNGAQAFQGLNANMDLRIGFLTILITTTIKANIMHLNVILYPLAALCSRGRSESRSTATRTSMIHR